MASELQANRFLAGYEQDAWPGAGTPSRIELTTGRPKTRAWVEDTCHGTTSKPYELVPAETMDALYRLVRAVEKSEPEREHPSYCQQWSSRTVTIDCKCGLDAINAALDALPESLRKAAMEGES